MPVGGPGGPGGGPVTPPPGGIDPAPGSEANIARIKDELVERLSRRMGGEALRATNVEISAEDMKTAARGLAIDKAENFVRDSRAPREAAYNEKLKREAAKKGMDFNEYRQKVEKSRVRTFIRFVKDLPNTLPEIAKRAKKMNAYEKVAEKAMMESGRYEAGLLAIDHYMASGEGKDKREDAIKNAIEDVKDLDDQNRFIDRIQKKNAKEGDFANDEKVEIFEEGQESRKKALQNLYASYMLEVTKAGDTDTDNEKVAEARKTLLGAIDLINDRKKGTGQVNTYKKLAEEIDDKFRGALKNEFESGDNVDEHKAGLAAIDEYIEKNLEVINGRIKAGLDMDEKKMVNRTDKLIMSRGAILGTGISLATGFLGSIPKIKALQLFGLASTRLLMKMAFAGVIGYFTGRAQRNKGQRYEDARQAVGEDEWREGDKVHYRKTKVSNYINTLNDMFDDSGNLNSYTKADGSVVAYKPEDVYNMLAEIYARKQVQKDKGVQLLSYDGRDAIERQKYELTEATGKAKEKLIKYLKDFGMTGAEDAINKIIEDKTKEIITGETPSVLGGRTKTKEGLLDELDENEKARTKERRASGRKKAKYGMLFAAAADYAWHHDQINAEVGQAANYFFGGATGTGVADAVGDIVTTNSDINKGGSESINTDVTDANGNGDPSAVTDGSSTSGDVDPGVTDGGGDVTPTDGIDGVDGVENVGANPEEVGEKIVYKPGAPILIDDDPDGGTMVWADNNGNGLPDNEEILFGKGDAEGLHLNRDADFTKLQETLGEHGLEAEKEAFKEMKYNQISYGDYMKKMPNVVDINETTILPEGTDNNIVIGSPYSNPSVEGMSEYIIPVEYEGELPDDAVLVIHLDGKANGQALVHRIIDGQAFVPAAEVDIPDGGGNIGSANVLGRVSVCRIVDGKAYEISDAINGNAIKSSDQITALLGGDSTAITITDSETGQVVSQVAVNARGEKISNLSEVYNSLSSNGEFNRDPYFISSTRGEKLNEEAQYLSDGTRKPDIYSYSGDGYDENFDPTRNNAFKGVKGNNPSLLGPANKYDLNGNGQFEYVEKAKYIGEVTTRMAQSPTEAIQYAVDLGLFEPENRQLLLDKVFNGNEAEFLGFLKHCGIEGDTVASVSDMNSWAQGMMTVEAKPYYGKFADLVRFEYYNNVDDYEFTTIGTRYSSYFDKMFNFDYAVHDGTRVAVRPYKVVDGVKVYALDHGFIYEEFGSTYETPGCEQLGHVPKKTTIEEEVKTTSEKEIDEKEIDEKETEEKSDTEKSIDEKTDTEKTNPEKTDPEKTNPEKTEPEKTEPEKTEPEKTEPEKTEPEKTEPEKTEPEKTEPEKTEPEKTEPEKTEPEKTEPEKTEPEKTEPEKTEPEKTEPEKTDPEKTNPEKTEPEKTEPEKTEPEKTEPEKTEPEKTEPEKTEPEKTEPEKTLAEKTGDMHTGGDNTPMGTTEEPEGVAGITKTTPDNDVDMKTTPGSTIQGTDETIYDQDTVTDPSTGQAMSDGDGNLYITKPDGSETPEEITDNIGKDTQTTLSTSQEDLDAWKQTSGQEGLLQDTNPGDTTGSTGGTEGGSTGATGGTEGGSTTGEPPLNTYTDEQLGSYASLFKKGASGGGNSAGSNVSGSEFFAETDGSGDEGFEQFGSTN